MWLDPEVLFLGEIEGHLLIASEEKDDFGWGEIGHGASGGQLLARFGSDKTIYGRFL